jgi:hypothetical protein
MGINASGEKSTVSINKKILRRKKLSQLAGE